AAGDGSGRHPAPRRTIGCAAARARSAERARASEQAADAAHRRHWCRAGAHAADVCAQDAALGFRLVRETMPGVAEQASAVANRASGSNFYLAMRILPKAQREAMYEIYSFCRLVDDIADGDAPRPDRIAALAQWRNDIEALYAGHPPDHLQRLAVAMQQFGMLRQDFLAVIDGMEMDAREDIRAPDLA